MEPRGPDLNHGFDTMHKVGSTKALILGLTRMILEPASTSQKYLFLCPLDPCKPHCNIEESYVGMLTCKYIHTSAKSDIWNFFFSVCGSIISKQVSLKTQDLHDSMFPITLKACFKMPLKTWNLDFSCSYLVHSWHGLPALAMLELEYTKHIYQRLYIHLYSLWKACIPVYIWTEVMYGSASFWHYVFLFLKQLRSIKNKIIII